MGGSDTNFYWVRECHGTDAAKQTCREVKKAEGGRVVLVQEEVPGSSTRCFRPHGTRDEAEEVWW